MRNRTAPDWIVEKAFDCERVRGRKFTAIARIGRPILAPAEGELSAYGRCPISLAPLVAEQWIGGEDQFQALCLALEFIRQALKAYVAEGGRVYYEKTKNPIDLDDPSFLPLATLTDLRRRGTAARASRRRSTMRPTVKRTRK